MNAVDNEHSKNLQSDSWRFGQLKSHLANPNSDFHHFGTGNLKTLGALGAEEVHNRLKQNLASYFFSGNLRLCVLGKESLDQIETKVVEMFGGVPSSPSATPSQSKIPSK